MGKLISSKILVILALVCKINLVYSSDNGGNDELNKGSGLNGVNNSDSKSPVERLCKNKIGLYTQNDEGNMVKLDPGTFILLESVKNNSLTVIFKKDTKCTEATYDGKPLWKISPELTADLYPSSLTVYWNRLFVYFKKYYLVYDLEAEEWVLNFKCSKTKSERESRVKFDVKPQEPERFELEIESDDEDKQHSEKKDKKGGDEDKTGFPSIKLYSMINKTKVEISETQYEREENETDVILRLLKGVHCVEILVNGDSVWKHERGLFPESISCSKSGLLTLYFMNKKLRIRRKDLSKVSRRTSVKQIVQKFEKECEKSGEKRKFQKPKSAEVISVKAIIINVRDKRSSEEFAYIRHNHLATFAAKHGYVIYKVIESSCFGCFGEKTIWEARDEANLAKIVTRDGVGFFRRLKKVTIELLDGSTKKFEKSWLGDWREKSEDGTDEDNLW